MDKKVTIVGIGALGSHVVQFIRNFLIQIKIVDYDRVEQKNIQSQFHGKPSVGKNKTQALQQNMQFLFGIKIETIPHKLVVDNISVLLKDSDLIIDCLDNAESRKLVQKYSRENKIACLHGALDANGTFGRVVWDHSFIIDSESNQGAATCENGDHLPFIAIVASYLSYAAQIFLNTGKQTGFEINPGGVIRV